MVLGRVAGSSMPCRESFHLFPSLTCSLVLLTSTFTESGLTEDVSFQIYLHMSNWILWSWLAYLEILTINKPTCIARTHFFTQSNTFFCRGFSVSTPQLIAWTAAREWKICITLLPKSRVTSLCFKVFCKVLLASSWWARVTAASDQLKSFQHALCLIPLNSSDSLQFRFYWH